MMPSTVTETGAVEPVVGTPVVAPMSAETVGFRFAKVKAACCRREPPTGCRYVDCDVRPTVSSPAVWRAKAVILPWLQLRR